MVVDQLKQEEAWNYGLSADYTLYVGSHKLILNTEYFYTDFKSQAVVDYDTSPGMLTISQLNGKSYSHTFQADLTWESPFGLSATGAYRLNDPCGNCPANGTLSARTAFLWIFTVNCFSKYFCNGSLSCSPCSAKKVSMTNTFCFNLISQSCNNMILSLHIFKCSRSEFSVKGCI